MKNLYPDDSRLADHFVRCLYTQFFLQSVVKDSFVDKLVQLQDLDCYSCRQLLSSPWERIRLKEIHICREQLVSHFSALINSIYDFFVPMSS